MSNSHWPRETEMTVLGLTCYSKGSFISTNNFEEVELESTVLEIPLRLMQMGRAYEASMQ